MRASPPPRTRTSGRRGRARPRPSRCARPRAARRRSRTGRRRSPGSGRAVRTERARGARWARGAPGARPPRARAARRRASRGPTPIPDRSVRGPPAAGSPRPSRSGRSPGLGGSVHPERGPEVSLRVRFLPALEVGGKPIDGRPRLRLREREGRLELAAAEQLVRHQPGIRIVLLGVALGEKDVALRRARDETAEKDVALRAPAC